MVARRNHLPPLRANALVTAEMKTNRQIAERITQVPGIGRRSSPRTDDRYFRFAANSSLDF